MATEKWVAGSGQGLSWGSAFGTEINSLANGNAVLSSVSITNGTPLDMFCDVSIVSGASITTVAPAFLGIYVYPLNEDGSTYGDGRFGSAAAGPPPTQYQVGTIAFGTGTVTIAGVTRSPIIIPPGTFSFLMYNQAGNALASSNTCKYRTYNRQVA